MKPIFILLSVVVFLSFTRQHNNVTRKEPASSNQFFVKQSGFDSSQSIRIINNSSLKRLPGVIRDLSITLNKSAFQIKELLNKNGFAVDLSDVQGTGFEVSASVIYRHGDTAYHMQLNSFNKKASGKALAATLIHEIMHCVLLDMDKYARMADKKSIGAGSFDSTLRRRYNISRDEFFSLMNSGEAGQHELMYRLFYRDMVSLLKQFAKVHREPFLDYRDPDFLVWSGLQKTAEYEKLSYEERREIETAILREKGLYFP